jgi:hypothetical protein
MDEHMKTRVRLSLAYCMERWIDVQAGRDGLELPWTGTSIAQIMADAAFTVLCGMDDSQAYLIKEKMLKD